MKWWYLPLGVGGFVLVQALRNVAVKRTLTYEAPDVITVGPRAKAGDDTPIAGYLAEPEAVGVFGTDY